MSEREKRSAARTALALTMCLVLVFVILTADRGGRITGSTAFAQASPTPSGYTIEWVNPDADSHDEVSAQAKEGQSGTPFYHLVAWVNRIPPDAFVEFCIDDCAPTSERITDEQNGAELVQPDTWQHNWTNLPEDDDYTLTARFFSGGTLLDTDTVSVTVNNTAEDPPPPNSVSEGVEITDPLNGETHGFYQAPGSDQAVGVFDVAASTGATQIEAKYSITAPGSDPLWKSCGFESKANAANGLRCTLAEGDSPDEVTLVGAVAYDDPGAPSQLRGEFRESGDGHRIDSYAQVPEEVTLEFLNAEGTAATGDTAQANGDSCSPTLRTTVIDQNDEPVPGVNVDLHAQGPSDDIRFRAVDAMKAPDQGGHTSESAASDCAGATGGNQGDHDVPAGDDTKHVESTNNTNDAGQFSVQLFHTANAELPGETQITGWADLDGDDVFCSQEPNDAAAIGWGQSPPAPSTLPAGTESCTLPGQSPSPTPTPTPSDTASPTGTASPTTTTTTTTTTDDQRETQKVATTLTINYRRGLFSGSVGSSKKRCQRGRTVKLKQHVPGRNKVRGRDKSNRAGNWKKRPRRVRKGRYYATVGKKVFTNRRGTRIVCRWDKSPTTRAR